MKTVCSEEGARAQAWAQLKSTYTKADGDEAARLWAVTPLGQEVVVRGSRRFRCGTNTGGTMTCRFVVGPSSRE